MHNDGRSRVVITGVHPEIGCGRYAIKRALGEPVVVRALVFTDGHDLVRAALLYRRQEAGEWLEIAMQPLAQDRWQGEFVVSHLGRYEYTIEAWVDHFQTWRRDLEKRQQADAVQGVDLLEGERLLRQAAARASRADAAALNDLADILASDHSLARRTQTALDPELAELMDRYPDRRLACRYDRELPVSVDRPKARFSAWYELFPRSTAAEPGAHGTLADCARRLPYVASMGFDVLYLPPIHPIGVSHRKGKNNQVQAGPDDTGSPWAIGSAEGGHKAIHPQLGTLADLRRLVGQAGEYGIELALDIAFQCSPDHPYVREHPQWFRMRADGTIQYAENPPKKYQDIYPFDFETDDWRALWDELKSIITFWIEQGIRIFRVDNPHTKPVAFWEWLIGEVRRDHPEAIFLSEAFTRPHMMYELARVGFTQSYTYFTWRSTSWELTQYFTELTQTDLKETFRPNVWPNTPDILPEMLQTGGRPAFMARLILAATLSANYGIYGPAFELCESRAREPHGEEYLHSEKYEIKSWDLASPHTLAELIGRINRIRRENLALQSDDSLRFHPTTNEQLIAYSKQEGANVILVVVNLDPHHTHSGWLDIDLDRLEVEPARPFQVHDLLGDARYQWQGRRNYVELNPHVVPAHIFRVRRWVRSEREFEYFM